MSSSAPTIRIGPLFALLLLFQGAAHAQAIFAPPNIILETETSEASDVFAADLNGDGYMDVLSASRNDSKIAWYENDGTGNFGAQRIISTEAELAESVYAADLDADGDLDVLSASVYDDKVAWYRNDGTGQFSAPIVLSSGIDAPRSVVAGDIDLDGDPDVVCSSSLGDALYWFMNDGSGSFGTGRLISDDINDPFEVTLADLDGDGDTDVISANRQDDNITWFPNDGWGSFGTAQIAATGLQQVRTILAVDMDGDDDPDLVSSDFSGDEVVWFSNDGSGVFGLRQVIATGQDNVTSVFSADLDDDGDVDVLSASTFHHTISAFLNDGSGSFAPPSIISSSAYAATSVFAADLDNDGDWDVLSASSMDNKIAWYENSGTGTFGSMYLISHGANTIYSAYSADLNGDGHQDVITGSHLDRKVAWHAGDGQGGFSRQILIADDANCVTEVFAVDLDGDGDTDVLSASRNDHKIAWYENDGQGAFTSHLLSSNALGAIAVLAADLDGDGDMDITSASYDDDKIAWYEQLGSGEFSSEKVISTSANGPNTLMVADLDGDGDMDLLSSSSLDNKIGWFANDGSGNFSPFAQISSTAFGRNVVKSGDVNGDGFVDVLALSYNTGKVAWFAGDGQGNFGSEQLVTSNNDPFRSMDVADIDNDGDPDVAVSIDSRNVVVWYENDGEGNFGTEQIISSSGETSFAIRMADLDGDLDWDVIVGTTGEHDYLYWSENLLGEALITKVRGRAFLDRNQDGIFNGKDAPVRGHQIAIEPSGFVTITNNEGEYVLYTSTPGTNNISIAAPTIYDCLGSSELVLSSPEAMPFEFEYQPGLTIALDLIFVGPDNGCRDIGGIVFNDENENGLRDGDEQGLQDIHVEVAPFGYLFTEADGSYLLSVPDTSDIAVSVNLPDDLIYGYCAISGTVYEQTFPAGDAGYELPAASGSADTLDFGVNVEMSAEFDAGFGAFFVEDGNEAGEVFTSWVGLVAHATTSNACTLRLEHSPSIEFIDANLSPATIGLNSVEWAFPAESIQDALSLEINWQIASSVSVGDTLRWRGEYLCGPTQDACPFNDVVEREVIVEEAPGSGGLARMYSTRPEGTMPETISAGTVLSYMIFFENPLPDTAFSVIVTDILPAGVNSRSVSRTSTSMAGARTTVGPTGTVIWELSGNGLPPVLTDPLSSGGYVQIYVVTEENLPPGTVIPNKAMVHFNGEVSIETNTVVHRIESVVGIHDISSLAINAFVSPNPASEAVKLLFDQPPTFIYDLYLVDISGRVVMSRAGLSGTEASLPAVGLPSGIYFLNIIRSSDQAPMYALPVMVEGK